MHDSVSHESKNWELQQDKPCIGSDYNQMHFAFSYLRVNEYLEIGRFILKSINHLLKIRRPSHVGCHCHMAATGWGDLGLRSSAEHGGCLVLVDIRVSYFGIWGFEVQVTVG